MKNLLLSVLSETRDYEDFRQKLVAALKASIQKDAEFKIAFAHLREEVIKGAEMSVCQADTYEGSINEETLVKMAQDALGRDLRPFERGIISEYGEAAFKAMFR